MTGQIIIHRDDLGNYWIDSDTDTGFITEQLEEAVTQVRNILQRQDRRIAEFRERPERFAVKCISQLPS